MRTGFKEKHPLVTAAAATRLLAVGRFWTGPREAGHFRVGLRLGRWAACLCAAILFVAGFGPSGLGLPGGGQALAASSASAPKLPAEVERTLDAVCGRTQVYGCYTNHKYGYVMAYPKQYLTPQGEADDGGGQAFTARDSRAELAVWATYNSVLGESIQQLFAAGCANPELNVTYKHLGRNFFVLSGFQAGRIFYRKTVIDNDVQASFVLSYDPSLKEAFNPLVGDMAKAFTIHPAFAWQFDGK